MGRRRIILDSDSEDQAPEEVLSQLGSDSDSESAEPTGMGEDTDWLRKFKIPKNVRKWTADQIKNLRANFKGLEDLDDSILQGASLSELAVMSRQKLSGHKVFSKSLAATYERLVTTPVKIEAGDDHCTGAAHNSRFLRGYVGDSQNKPAV